jgi:TfoX/Sxy family transcriptional regulator of competence genes
VGTSAETMLYFADQLQACRLGAVRYRKMFGEYAIYLNEQVFALACDDRLFFKIAHLPAEAVDQLFGNRDQPFDGASGYAAVAEGTIEEVDELRRRAQIVLATLPIKAAKKKSKKKPASLKPVHK